MDIQAEKLYIIEKLTRLEDTTVIRKVKAQLQDTPEVNVDLLEASIERGLAQSKSLQVRPHEEVMKEIRFNFG